MITTLPTQEQVDRIARELPPDVVQIRMDVGMTGPTIQQFTSV